MWSESKEVPAVAVNVAMELATLWQVDGKAGEVTEVLQGVDRVHAAVAVDVA